MAEVLHDFPPLVRIYKDGCVQRLLGTDTVPPSFDNKTGVESKYVIILSDPAVSARLYVPRGFLAPAADQTKVPVLVYFHGGRFCIESATSPTYHKFLNSLVSAANIVCVSVEYCRAPEYPLPAAYEDTWAALKWVASHADGTGQDEWLNAFADLKHTFLAGDSAGGNIAHYVALRFGTIEKLSGIVIEGAMLVHPYFWGIEPLAGEETEPEKIKMEEGLWRVMCPGTTGNDDPRINPAKDPNLGRVGCRRVAVFVAEQDMMWHRGVYYAELLRGSGWGGKVEVVDMKGEGHVFHLFNPGSDKAADLMKKMVNFINANNSN